MSQNYLGGPGVNLPFPQPLYPQTLAGAALTAATNRITLAAGEALLIPGGDWFLQIGQYTFLQVLDPVTQVWTPVNTVGGVAQVHSDGQNFRLANLTGCPIGAVVTAAGSNYVQASTTVTASAGGSTWVAIVGGAVNTSVTVGTAGSGYTLPPLVIFSAPTNTASGYGVPATGYATISAGAVTGITVTNQGAGYSSAPTITVLPSPNDPNAGAVTAAAATCTLTGAGTVTAVLCTSNGYPQASAPTLTIAGVGSSATATATMCWTVTGTIINDGGGTYTDNTYITTVGGVSAATPVYTNPAIEKGILRPRAASLGVTVTAGAISATGPIYDGGLFAGSPVSLVLSAAAASGPADIDLTLGGAPDFVYITPL